MRHPSLIAGGHTPYQSMTAFILCRCTRCFFGISRNLHARPGSPKKYALQVVLPYWRPYYCTHPHENKKRISNYPWLSKSGIITTEKKSCSAANRGLLAIVLVQHMLRRSRARHPPILALSSTTLRLLNLSFHCSPENQLDVRSI